MLATSLLTFIWWRTRHRQTAARYAVIGALVGAVALVRWQDAVFLAAPVMDAVSAALSGPGDRATRWRRSAINLLACAGAAAAAFVPQMIVWFVIYGDPLLVPQGSGFMRWSDPHGLDVLFSTFRGLFTWTPVVALSLAGIFLVWSRLRQVGMTLAVIFLLSWYVNASAADWWAGEAFGARRFVSCFPIFVIGCSAALHGLSGRPRLSVALVALVIGCNLLLLLQYQLFLKGWRDLAPYPDDMWSLWVSRFTVPFRLLARVMGR
jgi:hypothetical protein